VLNDPIETVTTVIRHEEHRNLRQALEILPQEQREVVILRYYAELTIPEIALAIKQREGTIKSRLSRALDRLEKVLQDDGTIDKEVYNGQDKIRARA
jgi:RNA polymerase sigma-70 factor (ECF subfamily)